jgi:antitoxin (DNA-binding transcriptional repressor) of toxin-antitoxin stability system
VSHRRQVALVVEGHGEVQALPLLVRRILAERGHTATVTKPHRIQRSRMLSELRRAVSLHRARVGEDGLVLIVFDADDCDAGVAAGGALDVAADGHPVAVCVAVREYEAWFLSALESLASHRAVCDDAAYEEDPELRRGAKEQLRDRMTEPYRETIHQPAFSQLMDLTVARRRSPSFAGLCHTLWQWAGDEGHGT